MLWTKSTEVFPYPLIPSIHALRGSTTMLYTQLTVL